MVVPIYIPTRRVPFSLHPLPPEILPLNHIEFCFSYILRKWLWSELPCEYFVLTSYGDCSVSLSPALCIPPFTYPSLHVRLDFQSCRLIPATSNTDSESLNKNNEIVHFINTIASSYQIHLFDNTYWAPLVCQADASIWNTEVKGEKRQKSLPS